MQRRLEISDQLRRLADQQSQVVSREQALGTGLSPSALARLLRDGQWLRIGQGLYGTVPVPPSWTGLAWGGTLLGGPHARLGPEASGHLYGLVRSAPLPIDVLVPEANPVRVQGPWRFRRERDGVRPARLLGDPPRLSAECAVLDLVAQGSAGAAVGLVTVAVQQGLTTSDRLRRELGRRPRQRHRDFLTGLLAETAAGVESCLELMYLRTVERPHRLPKGVPQGSLPDLPYEEDVRYDAFAVIVELDGRLGHEGEGRFRDMHRDNRHALRDQLTLRFGYFAVADQPCVVAFQVYLALRKHGYREPFVRCARCRRVPEAQLESG